MKKSDIIKLVFAAIFTVAALLSCIFAVTASQSVRDLSNENTAAEETTNEAGESATESENKSGGNEIAEEVGRGIGLAFVAVFGMLAAILFAGVTVINDLIASIICAVGLRSPDKPAKIVFGSLLAANIVLALVAVIATFAGH